MRSRTSAPQRPLAESPHPAVSLVRPAGDWGSREAVLRLVGSGKRVLLLGSPPDALHDELAELGCEVVTAGADAGELALPGDAAGDGFDVALAVQALDYLQDPVAVLASLKAHLRADGYLVAAVPNVAHGRVRLAMLAGQFPFADRAAAPRRFFTYESFVALLEDAGFAVGAIERHEEDVGEPEGTADAPPAELLDLVSRAPEARTVEFVALAYPLPKAGLGWLQGRLLELAERHAAARAEAEQLRQDLGATKNHLRMLVEQQEASLQREKELRAKVLEAHELQAARDEEYRTATRGLQEAAAAREAHLTAHWQAEAAALRAEASAREADLLAALARAEHHAREAAHRRDELEAHLNRFRRSLPGRLYRAARAAARRVRGR